MKSFKNYKILFLVVCLIIMSGCDNSLNVDPKSEYSVQFETTAGGINGILNSAYSNIQYNGFDGSMRIYMEEASTDVLQNFRGGLNLILKQFMDFSWDPTLSEFSSDWWDRCYRAIRDSNTILANIDKVKELSEEEKMQIKGEARFIRALGYSFLYKWFGPVPLITSPITSTNDENINAPRATEQEILDFVETELVEAADQLPENQVSTGRATKGAALGVLTKFLLQTKQWVKAADRAEQVMNMQEYSLISNVHDLFDYENEGNEEMIFVFPGTTQSGGIILQRDAFPPAYPTECQISGTQMVVPVEFYNTYEAEDERREMFLTEYTNTNGEHIDLLQGDEFRNPRSFKYPIDPECANRVIRADVPLIRYADILLSRAEALVMSSGTVSQEAIDLVNQVRNRANLPDLQSSDVPDQNTFIDKLLRERAWEFIREAKRRDDLIRHDRFIQNARNRGINTAQEFHRLFPIPQSELDANSNIEQNPGY